MNQDDNGITKLGCVNHDCDKCKAQQEWPKPKFVRNVDGVPCITLVEHEYLMRSRTSQQPAYRAVKTFHEGKPVYVAEQPERPYRLLQDNGSKYFGASWDKAEQPVQQEIEELTAQRDKLADILTRTANALKGQPAELSLHSWHDLPEVAQQLKAAQQQEPVATDWERIACVQDAKLRAMCDEPGGFEKLCEVMDRYERTSPPASKPWVGLTPEDKLEIEKIVGITEDDDGWMVSQMFTLTEAKLKEKNT